MASFCTYKIVLRIIDHYLVIFESEIVILRFSLDGWSNKYQLACQEKIKSLIIKEIEDLVHFFRQ